MDKHFHFLPLVFSCVSTHSFITGLSINTQHIHGTLCMSSCQTSLVTWTGDAICKLNQVKDHLYNTLLCIIFIKYIET